MAMTAVLANGTVVELSPERCGERLWGAFAVSAGRLGVIVDVTLRIIPNEVMRRDVEVMSTREMLAELAEVQADARATAAAEAAEAAAGAADDDDDNDNLGLSPEMWKSLNERNYLWFMTRDPGRKRPFGSLVHSLVHLSIHSSTHSIAPRTHLFAALTRLFFHLSPPPLFDSRLYL